MMSKYIGSQNSYMSNGQLRAVKTKLLPGQ